MSIKIVTQESLLRRCGECSLCCKLLPMSARAYSPAYVAKTVNAMIEAGWVKADYFDGMVPDFDKPAGERCPHQRHNGCAIYAKRPVGCRFWNCRWLISDDTDGMRRPDRAGYVIDIMPDFVTTDDGTNIEVIQIWIDPKRPDAWRSDKELLDYLERRGAEGKAALLRFGSRDALTRFPISMSNDGEPHEVRGRATEKARTPGERIEGLLQCHKARSAT